MFYDGLSYHHGAHEPQASPYNDDGEHRLVVILTFLIFFSFVVIYLTVGIVWGLAIAALAVALSFCYLRHLAALRRARAFVSVRLISRSNGGSGLDRPDPAVPRLLPAFAYKREGGGGDAGAGSGWAQCVICLGIVQVGEVVRRLPACNHLFHVDCIDMWLHSHSTCPICRAVVGLPSEADPV